MEIYTIGFVKKSAEEFFGILRKAKIKTLIDVRLNNTSQLAGFTKQEDLAFFLRELCSIEYKHSMELAPSKDLFDAIKGGKITWDQFEEDFGELLKQRNIEATLDRSLFKERAVLLCSEATSEQCHRRLVAEYFKEKWDGATIVHL